MAEYTFQGVKVDQSERQTLILSTVKVNDQGLFTIQSNLAMN